MEIPKWKFDFLKPKSGLIKKNTDFVQEKSDFEIENPNILKNIRHQNAEVGLSGAKVGLSKKKLDIRLSKKNQTTNNRRL